MPLRVQRGYLSTVTSIVVGNIESECSPIENLLERFRVTHMMYLSFRQPKYEALIMHYYRLAVLGLWETS